MPSKIFWLTPPTMKLSGSSLAGVVHIANVNNSFRPQQGLTIMNIEAEDIQKIFAKGFRPQQGLTIMNLKYATSDEVDLPDVSVPNRG